MAALLNLTGLTYGDLTITTRAGSYINGVATWNATCTCGGTTVARSDFLTTGRTHHCGDPQNHPRKRQTVLTYSGAHSRLQALLGKAADRQCACGSQAAEWAFTGCDEAVMTNGRAPYCVHACPDEYTAMCRPCADLMDVLVREQIAA